MRQTGQHGFFLILKESKQTESPHLALVGSKHTGKSFTKAPSGNILLNVY